MQDIEAALLLLLQLLEGQLPLKGVGKELELTTCRLTLMQCCSLLNVASYCREPWPNFISCIQWQQAADAGHHAALLLMQCCMSAEKLSKTASYAFDGGKGSSAIPCTDVTQSRVLHASVFVWEANALVFCLMSACLTRDQSTKEYKGTPPMPSICSSG